MAQAVPSTQQEWLDLAKILSGESAADYPGLAAADFEEFRNAATGRSGPTWIIQAIIPALVAFLIVTQYVLKIVEWGGVAWILAVVIGAVSAGLVNTQIVKVSRNKAIALGKQHGFFI
jgi:hypothetical protein